MSKIILFINLSIFSGIYSQADPLQVKGIELPNWSEKNITAIHMDKRGILWICSRKNIMNYNSHLFSDFSFLLDSIELVNLQ
jgi:ligand-binding sensor domain-containing protein